MLKEQFFQNTANYHPPERKKLTTTSTSASPPKHPGLKKIQKYPLCKFQTFLIKVASSSSNVPFQLFGISEQFKITCLDFRQVGGC